MDVKVKQTQEWLNNTYSYHSNYTVIDEDGYTGFATFNALIKALQIEIGVTVDGDFGAGTLAACPTKSKHPDPYNAQPENINYIIQGSLWCKGYNPGGFTGVFGNGTESAIKTFQGHAGITQDGIVRPYILKGIMNTDGYTLHANGEQQLHEIQKGLNQHYGSTIGLTAPNGIWERKSQENLIKALQIETNSYVDGLWGYGTMNACPTLYLGKTGYPNSTRILKWALCVNGFSPNNFSTIFDQGTHNAVYAFQDFLCLGADGYAGKTTWASLMSSAGRSSRTATACDMATRLDATTAAALVNDGYDTVGRYLTNTGEGAGYLDKKMTADEIQVMADAGLKVFPIYQTFGASSGYFSKIRGFDDATIAKEAAYSLGFPQGTVVYFAVDFDVLTDEIDSIIVPHFEGINAGMGSFYQIGIYAPRSICSRLYNLGLTTFSFVADMSSRYTGNIGQQMPINWAYDQFYETFSGVISIDKCIASPRATAIEATNLSPIRAPFTQAPGISFGISAIKTLFDQVKTSAANTGSVINYLTTSQKNNAVLDFLRSSQYDGLMWEIAAGSVDSNLINDMSLHTNIHSGDVYLSEPLINMPIDYGHAAAVLLALRKITTNNDLGALCGWAGDLLHLGIGLYNSYIGSQIATPNQPVNYLSDINVVKSLIGHHDDVFNNITIYDKHGNVYNHSNFKWGDMCHDIDVFNIYKHYNMNSQPIDEILIDYYSSSGLWKNRFSIFEQNIRNEFNVTSLIDAVLLFDASTNLNVSSYVPMFYAGFGELELIPYPSGSYITSLALAFNDKINYLIDQE